MPPGQTTEVENRLQPAAQHQPAPSFGRLAKQIAVWTTRGLACALVLVLAVGLGVQTLRWWRTEPVPGSLPRAAADDPLGDLNRWHVLHFASQPWQIHRRLLHGDKSAAIDALRQRCREMLQQPAVTGLVASLAEAQLLEKVAGGKPLEEQPGRWKLYCNDQTLPVLVGVSFGSPTAEPAETEAAEYQSRVLLWALAVQQAADAWALYVFQPQQQEQKAAGSAARLTQVELPTGAVRTLEMNVAPGGTVVAFRCFAGLDACQKFYDDWFAAHRWAPVTGWQQLGAKTRCARFRHLDHGVTADVHFSAAGPRVDGLLMLWPSSP